MHFFHGCLSRVKQERKTCTIFLNMKTKVVHHQYPKMKSFAFQERNPPSQTAFNHCRSLEPATIDGAAAINMLKPTNTVKAFQEYADLVFIPYFKGQLQHVQRLGIIWDEYVPNCLKETTRGKRGCGIRWRVQSLITVPKKWKEFLRVDANKKGLFDFLAKQFPLVDFGDGKQVITTKGEQVLCSPLRFDTSLTPCNHEETDTRILVYATDASKAGQKNFAIRTVDTDFVIICIGMTQKLWIAFGTGTSLRYLAVHEIASRLGPEKARSLPVFHAFTGCDAVSCFSGTAWITWMKQPLLSWNCLTTQMM